MRLAPWGLILIGCVGSAGSVQVRFIIGRDGTVSNVSNAGSRIADAAVVQCTLRSFCGISFPAPEGGIAPVSISRDYQPD